MRLEPANTQKPAAKKKKTKPRVPGQTELLLPIPGNKAEKADEKKPATTTTRRKAG